MKQVLIIEDDENIVGLLTIHLIDLGCSVEIANDGLEGFDKARKGGYDLMIIDIMLPRMDGTAICQKLRAMDNFTPIMMLTAKSEEFDIVLGLELGADDYLTKPFSVREFIARVKTILRRKEQNEYLKNNINNGLVLNYGSLEIDIDKRKTILNGTRIDLTPKEFELLILLAQHPGKSYSRDQLLSKVWGYEFNGYEHTVNSHINRLRSKIEPNLSSPAYILTTWGVGYRFNDEI